MGDDKRIKEYMFLGIFLLVVLVSYFIVRGFVIALVSSFVLAYLMKPLHDVLSKKFSPRVSAFISILIVFFILFLILFFVIDSLVDQARDFSSRENVENIIDWNIFKKRFRDIIPFKNKNKILKKFSNTSHNIVFGTLLIALIEFVVALIGFKLSGITFFILFSVIVGLMAFIPLLGPTIVWVPMSIFLLLQGNYSTSLGVVITGVILSWGVDFFIRIQILGKFSKIHPVILLVGVLGGIQVFGLFGFIIGPLVLGFLIDLIGNGNRVEKR
jgi:predicted PurR-regulated permease PerM